MTTVVADLVAAVHGALSSATAVADDVLRLRFSPVPVASASSATVYPIAAEREVDDLGYGSLSVWAVRLGVELAVRAGATDANTAELRLDALVQATLDKLLTDPTLAAAVPFGIAPAGLMYDFDSAGDQFAKATLQLTARMQAGANLTTA
jgi:hypothetical protein